MITPTARVTNHPTWPDHMTGLVGCSMCWRREERDGEREGNEMMKQTRLLEERAGNYHSFKNSSWIQTFHLGDLASYRGEE